jgi:DtxR family transcriptional regulator, Mn-dependent transcriptional regulator
LVMLSEISEEYLECIFDLTLKGEAAKTSDIAVALKIAPASATEMIQKLAGERYLVYEKYQGVTLTSKGLKIAKKIKRRHRLLERFLVDVVGVKHPSSHEEACRLEHVISDDSECMICQITNNPKFCPDGDPIPVCEEQDCPNCISKPPISLRDLKEGEGGRIAFLKCEEPTNIRRLISMGFVPGRDVSVEEHTPIGGPILVKLQDSRIALAWEYADLILIDKDERAAKVRRSKKSG